MAIWALVTGASEGLGHEFATLAAKNGFAVILNTWQTSGYAAAKMIEFPIR